MLLIEKIAERKIQEAVDRGEFDNLPLSGKPLPEERSSGMSSQLRLSFKILKNANVIPEEVQLKKEIHSLRDLLALCDDEGEIDAIHRQLNEKMLRYELLIERRNTKTIPNSYRKKLRNRFR